jgi:hypothetical protein
MNDPTQIDDVPINLVKPDWKFSPGIRKRDAEGLKGIFARSAVEWLMKTIREGVASLQSDPALKIAYRVAYWERFN